MTETWTVLKVLTWTAAKFAQKGLPSARLDAEVLLARVLGVSRVALYTGHDQPLQGEELVRYRELIRRRLAGEPVAYLVGEQEFWSLPLWVDERVLVPRADTEALVEVALRAARARPRGPLRIADVATGSGAVAVALATELPEAHLFATDASADALEVAKKNVARHGLDGRITLAHGDLCDPLPADLDIIASNPPYIPTADLAALQPEVRREPRAALDGGPDGLAVYRRLIPAAAAHLRPGATLALEHAHDQAAPVTALLTAAGYTRVTTTPDLSGTPRITSGTRS